jgi:hypothetical protein
LKEEVLTVAKKEQARAGQEQSRDLVEGTEWKKGPAYLRFPESEWPIKTDIMEDTNKLPKEEMRKQYTPGFPTEARIKKENTEKHQVCDQEADLDHGTKTIQMACARGWISSLQMEHELANLATKLGLDCWQKYAGKDTITLLENGGLDSRSGEMAVQRHWSKKQNTA